MKRLYGFMAVLATAGITMAAIDPITGDNEVGFAGVVTLAGSTILTVPFEACLEGGDPGFLSDLVSTNGLTAHASDPASADQLVVMVNDSGLKYNYYWLKTGDGWTALTTSQLMPDGSEEARSPGPASAFEISRGLGFWLKRPAASEAATVYVKGQVASTNQSTAISVGLNLVGVGSVESFTLNGGAVSWTGAQGGTGNTATADKIMVPNASGGFDQYFFFEDPTAGNYSTIDNKWITSAYEAADVTIPAGRGFWYLRRGATGFAFAPGL